MEGKKGKITNERTNPMKLKIYINTYTKICKCKKERICENCI